MRIVFIGCVKSSELFLKKLVELKADVVGVVTKAESKFNADFVDIGKVCREYAIDYIYVENANERKCKLYIEQRKPDVIMCLGWSQLLDEEMLAMPTIGCIGFHPAELPYNRGRHPLIWALALGLEQTASTFFFMNSKADMGGIISQEKVSIEYTDDAMSLYEKIMSVAVKQLEQIINQLRNHTVQAIPQDAGKGNTWRKRGKKDGEIDWRMSSRAVYNLVRALTKPYVGAHFVYQGQEIKVWKVREIITNEYNHIEPGKILKVESKNQFWVKTGDNVIEVLSCDAVSVVVGDYL